MESRRITRDKKAVGKQRTLKLSAATENFGYIHPEEWLSLKPSWDGTATQMPIISSATPKPCLSVERSHIEPLNIYNLFNAFWPPINLLKVGFGNGMTMLDKRDTVIARYTRQSSVNGYNEWFTDACSATYSELTPALAQWSCLCLLDALDY